MNNKEEKREEKRVKAEDAGRSTERKVINKDEDKIGIGKDQKVKDIKVEEVSKIAEKVLFGEKGCPEEK